MAIIICDLCGEEENIECDIADDDFYCKECAVKCICDNTADICSTCFVEDNRFNEESD